MVLSLNSLNGKFLAMCWKWNIKIMIFITSMAQLLSNSIYITCISTTTTNREVNESLQIHTSDNYKLALLIIWTIYDNAMKF